MQIEDLPKDERDLAMAALKYRGNSYSPYSKFAVGAAVMTKDGKIYGGANVENASFSMTICAERNAIFSAVADGAREFAALALAADSPNPVTPCGACRQVMAEFGIERIIMLNTAGDVAETRLTTLLPDSFGSTYMNFEFGLRN